MWGGVRSSGIKTTQTAGTAQLLRRECANALAVGVWQSQRVLVLLVPPSALLYHWSDVVKKMVLLASADLLTGLRTRTRIVCLCLCYHSR